VARGESGDSEQLALMERLFLNFRTGSRVCLGKNISLIEARMLIPQLLREFDVEFTNGREWTARNMWFTPQETPRCVLTRRK